MGWPNPAASKAPIPGSSWRRSSAWARPSSRAPTLAGVSSYEVRRGRLRERLGSLDVEAALITRPVNVRYLSGYTGSNGALLVGTDARDLLATDGRYTEQAAQECPGLEVLLARQCAPALLEHAAAE